jgi:uncharacterized membrane protein YecN with MAPEG domain
MVGVNQTAPAVALPVTACETSPSGSMTVTKLFAAMSVNGTVIEYVPTALVVAANAALLSKSTVSP